MINKHMKDTIQAYIVICFLMLLFTTSCGSAGKTKGLDKLVIVVEKGVHKHITEQLKDMIAEVEEETGIEIPLETSGKYDYVKNYFEDNNGKVINDLSKYASYFKHMSSYGTALTNKPADVVVEPVEFWSISYDLNGGTSKDAFIYSYNRLSEFPIVLPIVTKENCVFNGWLLNNELVTEIPAGT